MARRQTALTEDEVREATADVLADRFGQFGFKTLEIDEDEDMDGAAILRMVAHVESKVPARELIDTLLAVQAALEYRGEERIVFLSTNIPGIEEPIEDDEE